MRIIYKATKVDGKKRDLHRYLMEQYLGRELKPDEVVHHINGNKLDNRIENLQVMSKSEHGRYHALLDRQEHPDHYKRRFNSEQIIEMRKLHKNGRSNNSLARQFHTSSSTMSEILRGITYSDII